MGVIMFKKFIALLVCVTMIMSMTSVCFASSNVTNAISYPNSSTLVQSQEIKGDTQTRAGGSIVAKAVIKALIKGLRSSAVKTFAAKVEKEAGTGTAKYVIKAAEPIAQMLENLIAVEELGVQTVTDAIVAGLTSVKTPLSTARNIAYVIKAILNFVF